MDNKQDRQFYWEVKNFMGKTHETKPVVPQSSTLNQVGKQMLEQQIQTKKSSFNQNVQNLSHIEKAIGLGQKSLKAGTPEIPVFTKNIFNNPFQSLKEGIFDDIVAGVKEIGELGTNILGKGQGAGKYGAMLPMTAEQSRERAAQRRAKEALALSPGQLTLQQAAGLPVKSSDIETALSTAKTTSGTSQFTQQQTKKLRDIQGQAVTRERKAEQIETEAQRIAAGAEKPVEIRPDTFVSRKPVDAVQGGAPKAAIAGLDTEGPPSPQEDMGPPKPAVAGVDTEGPAVPTEPTPTGTDSRVDTALAKMKSRQERRIESEKLAGAKNVEYLKAKAGAAKTPEERGRLAQALVTAERRAKGEASTKLSDEQMRGMAQRDVERASRTPEQKAAVAAKSKEVVTQLASAAEKTRAGEALAAKGKDVNKKTASLRGTSTSNPMSGMA